MQTGWYQDKITGENGTICGRRQETVWVACRRDGSRRTESGIFFDTRSGSSGAMLTGWQWIDGKCYYLDPAAGGAMAISNTLLDGSRVGSDAPGLMGPEMLFIRAGKGIRDPEIR